MSVSERQAGEGVIDRGKDTEVCQSVELCVESGKLSLVAGKSSVWACQELT